MRFLRCVHRVPCTLTSLLLHLLHLPHVFSQKASYPLVCRTFYPFPMAYRADGVPTHAGCFSNLALGKAGQLAQSLGTCCDPAILINLAPELDNVIKRTLLELSLEFLAAVSMFPANTCVLWSMPRVQLQHWRPSGPSNFDSALFT